MYNLLLISGKLNFTDGVSSHLYNLTAELADNKDLRMTILCTGGNSVNRFRRGDIRIIEDSDFDHEKRSFSNFASAVKKLIWIIKDNSIGIVHSHNHYAANIAYYASKFTRVKTVQTNHGLIPAGGKLKHFKADIYITVNEPSKEYLINNNIGTKQNIFFINQGVRLNESPKNKSEDEIKIICASRLIYDKGVDLFIKAVSLVRSKFSGNVKFLIAGSGEYESKLRELDTELKTDIEFLGEVKDLPGLFSQTNIFVMPTRSGSEGFPMTIAEAAMNRNLIITSDFNSFGNLFRDNTDGLIFKINDHQNLADKILFALNQPGEANHLADTFFRRSKILFDPQTMAEKHFEVYRKCLIK